MKVIKNESAASSITVRDLVAGDVFEVYSSSTREQKSWGHPNIYLMLPNGNLSIGDSTYKVFDLSTNTFHTIKWYRFVKKAKDVKIHVEF